ncbi:MAG TPA: agmatinase, partial [Rhodobacteraceae bacterium]|nr:agmatinase [Paracoccaceae bacterium]
MSEKQPGGDLAFTRTSLYGTEGEPSFSGALSFMRRRYSRDLDGVDVAVLGVPFDLATTNRPGARLGPRAIRAASSIMAWDRAWGWDFDPFDRLAVVDYGDCVLDMAAP